MVLIVMLDDYKSVAGGKKVCLQSFFRLNRKINNKKSSHFVGQKFYGTLYQLFNIISTNNESLFKYSI